MSIEIRAIEPGEFETMRQTMGLVFGFDPPEGDERFRKLVPIERTRCGFDDGRMVSTLGSFSLEMTVPGGKVPCGGTTMVAVAPTHRRRGVLRSMMRAHLDDVREHGEPIAGLWASDSAIYGRFGYGCASICCQVEIARDHVDFHRLAPEPSRVRMVDRDEALELAPSFYDRLRAVTPGFFDRSPEWWEGRSFRDTESARAGATSLRFAVVDGKDGIDGYATFRTKSEWDEHGTGKVIVKDLFGSSPGSWAGLWGFVLGQDLIATIEADLRSMSDPVFDLLAGTRRVHAERSDGLWIRIMDVPAALEARSYATPIDVVIEVADPMGDVSGRYRLESDGGETSCRPTDRTSDVTLDLEDLSSGYMGAPRFAELASAGRIDGDPEQLIALDRAFAWNPGPWCPEIF